MLYVAEKLQVPESELRESFIHAAGPGGQNVNKLATAVQLRFDIPASASLNDEVKQRLLHLARRRVNQQGVLIIEARRYRTQTQNRLDARRRLALLISAALHPPSLRKATHPAPAARQRRLAAKKQRSQLKRTRQNPRRIEE